VAVYRADAQLLAIASVGHLHLVAFLLQAIERAAHHRRDVVRADDCQGDFPEQVEFQVGFAKNHVPLHLLVDLRVLTRDGQRAVRIVCQDLGNC